MIDIPVYNTEGENTDSVSLDEAALGGRIKWKLLRQAVLSYESNKTGDTVTSNIQSWRYTDQEETVEPEQGLFEDLGFVIGLIVFLILLIIPLYVKFVYWND